MRAPRIAIALALAASACGGSNDSSDGRMGTSTAGGTAGSGSGGQGASAGSVANGGDAVGGATGGTDASSATGGTGASAAGGTGASATGGVGASGGANTTGGAGGAGAVAGAGGAGGSLECWTETGTVVPEAKACASSADCEAVPTYSCCGPGVIVGLAKDSEYQGCFTTTPPTECPPLGCASMATLEDFSQVEGGYYSPAALARCIDDGGTKSCTTTACIDHGTACDPGDVCTNGCGLPCACVGGVLVCDHPTPSTTCGDYVTCSYGDTVGAPATEICQCSSTGTTCTTI